MSLSKQETQLEGKVALVTGGNIGIGKVIALEYVRNGAAVVIASLPHPETEETLTELSTYGVPVLFVETDVTQFDSVERLLHVIASRFSRIDIAVNNAGILGPLGATELTNPQSWAETINVNLFGTYHVCRAVIPLMRAQMRGKIINLAGGGATTPLPNFSAYAASKAAIVRFTEVLAHEVADSNIQVNAISPGVVMTRLMKTILDNLTHLSTWEREYFAAEAAKGGNTPFLAARMAVFLGSERANHISGKVLSAVWDDIEALTPQTLASSEALFTLRRIDNKHFIQNKRGIIEPTVEKSYG